MSAPMPPDSMRLQARRVARAAALGAVCGLFAFAVEGAFLYSGEVRGFALDVSGPLRMLIDASVQALPLLLLRALSIYVIAGAALAVIAHSLLSLLRPRHYLLASLAEAAALLTFLVWHRAACRPALFATWHWFSPLCRLAQKTPPGAVLAALGVFLVAHLAVALARARVRARWLFPATALLIAFVPRFATETPKPLTVLIGIDALRPDALAHAPNTRALIADSVQFDNAYTSLAQTEPTWRSLLTARWPVAHGLRYPLIAQDKRAKLPLLSEQFSASGYKTEFVTDCSRFNYQSDFDILYEPPRGASNFVLEKLRFVGVGLFGDNVFVERLAAPWVSNRALSGFYDPIGFARRRADELVAQAHKAPLFWAFHATATHFPGDMVYPFYRQLPEGAPVQMTLGVDGNSATPDASPRARYDALVQEADTQLGIITDTLKRAGLYDSATIAVFSDHGEDFYDDRPDLRATLLPVHGARLGEDENRVVLAIKPPRGQARPHSVAALVRLVDVGPTLLDLAGAASIVGADGETLAPYLRGDAAPARLLYAETGFTHILPDVFDPAHFTTAPRHFESYVVAGDRIEVDPALNEAIIAEKDIGAFDGAHWLIRSPQKDGGSKERCDGNCDVLKAFLSMHR